MTFIFETERMAVRSLNPDDFAPLHRITGDAEIMQYVGDLQPYTPEYTRQIIVEAIQSYADNRFGIWAILDKATGEMIGYGGIEYLPERDIPEVAYIFTQVVWGKGYATEFATRAVEYGFRELNLPELGASFDPNNHASMRVARKIGFTFEREGLDEFKLPTIYYRMGNPYF